MEEVGGEAYFYMAYLKYKEGSFSNALPNIKRAIQINDKEPRYYYLHGDCLYAEETQKKKKELKNYSYDETSYEAAQIQYQIGIQKEQIGRASCRERV